MKIRHFAFAALALFTLSAAAAPKTPKKKKTTPTAVKSDLPAGKAATGTHFSYAYGVAQVPDMKAYLLQLLHVLLQSQQQNFLRHYH